VGKSGVLEHKSGNISETRKDRGNVTMERLYRNSPTLFRTAPCPTSYGLPFPKIGGSQPQPKTSIAIISETGKATDCKFGRYIHGVHPNKISLIWEKTERGRIQELPIFLSTPYYLGNG